MAIGVFDPAKHYRIYLHGHYFDRSLVLVDRPGHFVANTIEQYDPLTREREFAVFVVDRPKNGEYPVHHSGTFLIPMSALKQGVITEID